MIIENLRKVKQELGPNIQLVAVSKKRTISEIMALYNAGQRHFGENRVQELMDKKDHLPADIHWHLIGHLQRNKVKYIADFVHLIHSVDSVKLAREINKQALKNKRVIPVLAQIHIAQEESKFGIPPDQLSGFLDAFVSENMEGITLQGLMTMASLTENRRQIEQEFMTAQKIYTQVKKQLGASFSIRTMGMSSDYAIAVACGANLVRVGSRLFI